MINYFGAFIQSGCTVDGLKDGYKNLSRIFDFKRTVFEEAKEEDPDSRVLNENTVTDFLLRLKKTIKENNDGFPVTIGGDHSLAIASVSASYTEDMALIWIDAHGDSNTDGITISKRIHGMPVAVLEGTGTKKLTDVIEGNRINPLNVIYFGSRALDPLEEELMIKNGNKIIYMKDVNEKGAECCIEEAVSFLKGKKTYISFDLDSIDPAECPGVSIPEPDGLRKEDVYRLMERLFKEVNVIGMDIVEYNPLMDVEDKTLKIVDDIRNIIENNVNCFRNNC